MSHKIPITLACGGYDRMEALRTGEVDVEGVELRYLKIDDPREIFDRATHHEFEACEMSLSEYVCNWAAGARDYVAIPVFPSRAFRHSYIVVDSNDIDQPVDLEYKTIGVQRYAMTAAVWIRGILAQYDVDLSTINWLEGSFDHRGPHGTLTSPPNLHKPISITPNASEFSLSTLLSNGTISATVGAELPSTFPTTPCLTRLFHNSRALERASYKSNHIFPIMHTLVIRNSLIKEHPNLACALFTACVQSKSRAWQRLHLMGSLACMLPWIRAELEEVEEVWGKDGGDPGVYGFEANRAVLEEFERLLVEDGLIREKVPVEEMFLAMEEGRLV